jgi:hypothetical protein
LYLRFQSLADFLSKLDNLVPPAATDPRAQVADEIAAINDLLATGKARLIEAAKPALQSGSHAFLRGVNGALSDSGFVCGGSGPNFTQGDSTCVLNFFMVRSGAPEPTVHYNHVAAFNGSVVSAVAQVEGESTHSPYYTGSPAFVESFVEAANLKGVEVAKILLQRMRQKLQSHYG